MKNKLKGNPTTPRLRRTGNPQHNTVNRKVSKIETGYIAPEAADMIWMHQSGIQKLIQEMYETIMTDETIDSILDFLVRRRIPRASYYRWKAQYPELAEAHDVFNSIIGNRLFKRVNYDVKTIHIVMPNYDPHVWKQMVEYQAKLKEEDQATQKVVILESMCSHEDHK
jgi:hypothetical protein